VASRSNSPAAFSRKTPNSWTRDGRVLAFTENTDIWALRVDFGRKPEPFLRTPYKEFAAAFSPDGRWLAYQSNDSKAGRNLRAPVPGGRRQVASINPRRRDPTLVARWEGTVLFSRRHADGGGHHTRPDFPGGRPAGAVQARAALELRWRSRFSVMPDGEHFLMLQPAGAPFQIQVTLNWAKELTARVSTK
jgi:Periplasmic component of the Tol biopolymer transport system